jgi:thiamine-monophosphate kinase
VQLWGGDTVTGLAAAVLGLTAIGTVARGTAMGRGGAAAGDDVWVSGTIGDAGLGLAIARDGAAANTFLLNRFRRPLPRLALGQGLVGIASACMDVSDGVLIDADRLAKASNAGVEIALAAVPLSAAAAARTHSDADVLARVTAGDDYELLFTAAPGRADAVRAAAARGGTAVSRIGTVTAAPGLVARGAGGADLTPLRLGWEH